MRLGPRTGCGTFRGARSHLQRLLQQPHALGELEFGGEFPREVLQLESRRPHNLESDGVQPTSPPGLGRPAVQHAHAVEPVDQRRDEDGSQNVVVALAAVQNVAGDHACRGSAENRRNQRDFDRDRRRRPGCGYAVARGEGGHY